MSIRGLPSDQTLFVIDGIVANNPAFFGNTFDFANIDPADISKVEVLRGGQSTLYGSDAIAGVINVVTTIAVYRTASSTLKPSRSTSAENRRKCCVTTAS